MLKKYLLTKPFEEADFPFFIQDFKLLGAYSWLYFWNIYHKSIVYKNANRIGQRLQNLDTLLVFIVFLCGLFQALKPMSYKRPVLENFPIFQTSVIRKKWKTFYLSDLYPVILSPHKYIYIKKFYLTDNRLSMVMSPFWNKYQNPTYFGIFTENSYKNLSGPLASNYFEKKFFSVFTQPQDSLIFDCIPSSVESCWEKNPKFEYIPISKKKKTSLDLIKIDKISDTLKLKPLDLDFEENKLKIISRLNQIENEILENKNYINILDNTDNADNADNDDEDDQELNFTLKEFSKKLSLRNHLFRIYRDMFYKEQLFPMEFNVFLPSKPKHFRQTKIKQNNWYSKLKNFFIRRHKPKHVELEGLDEWDSFQILKILRKQIFQKSLKTLRPRFLSGYRFPDNSTKQLRYTNLNPIFAPDSLKKREVISIFLPIRCRQKLLNVFLWANQNQYHTKFADQKIDFLFYFNNSTIQNLNQKVYSKNKYKKRLIFYKDGINKNRSSKEINKTFVFRHLKIQDIREPIQSHSWLAFTQLGIGIIGFKILQHVYQEYGKEIVFSLVDCIKLIGVIQDDEWVKQELELDRADSGFRSIRKVEKSLNNVAGIGSLKPQMTEMVTFLKTRTLYLSRILDRFKDPSKIQTNLGSRSLLLIGPPGTGKTLFVQAIVGEADAPVLAQSGNVLKDYKERGRGARSIQNLFRRARQVSPCVIFIDEIDNIGTRRQFLSLNTMGEHDGIDILETVNAKFLPSDDLSKFDPKTDISNIPDPNEPIDRDDIIKFWKPYTEMSQNDSIKIKVLKELQVEQHRKNEQLGMLTQLLIELDGLHPLNDIIVIGATNRPQVLDPALLRSGRFHKVIKLRLPDHSKRIELLKFYSKSVGVQTSLPWNYLSERMIGLSAADIATIINTSALKAVSINTKHTMQSIEDAIEMVTSYSAPKNTIKFKYPIYYFSSRIKIQYSKNSLFSQSSLINNLVVNKNKFESNLKGAQLIQRKVRRLVFPQIKRLAYYKVGRAIIHLSLSTPLGVYLTLQERQKNFRYMAMNGAVINTMENFHFRFELEEKLIGFLAGKASEIILCCAPLGAHIKGLSKINFFNLSSLGQDELKFATLLSFLMAERWYFYAQSACTESYHPLLESFNFRELSPDEIRLFEALLDETETEMYFQNRIFAPNQKWSFRTWWIKQIYDEENLFDRSFMEWYRIFLPDPDELEQNIEWRPPDDFYLSPKTRSIKGFLYWNSFLKLTSNYIYRNLLLNAFNHSFLFLNKKRELLDYLVDFLFRTERVRSYQIQILMTNFLDLKNRPEEKVIQPLSNLPSPKIVAKAWGAKSRRKKSRFVDIESLKKLDVLSRPVKKTEKTEKTEKRKVFEKLKIHKSLLYLFKE